MSDQAYSGPRLVMDSKQDLVDEIAKLRTERDDLAWLVRRARGLHNAPRSWTKAERDRSWADWETHANAAITKADG